MNVQAEAAYNKIPAHIKQVLNLPLNYFNLSVDQMLFVDEYYMLSAQKVDVAKLKKKIADAAIYADLVYVAMDEMENILNEAD